METQRTMKRPPRQSRRPRPASWGEARESFLVSLADDDRSKHTRDHYRDDVGAFERWWEEERPGEPLIPTAVADEDVRDWKRALKEEWLNEKGLTRERHRRLDAERRAKGKEPLPEWVAHHHRKPAAVNAKLAALKSFLAWCEREGIIAALPSMPRRDKIAASRVKWLDEQRVKDLLRSLRNSKRDSRRNLPMVQIALGTGLRVGELVALRWGDVTLGDRKGDVEVRAGKGCKPRTIPIAKTARAAFRKLQELAPARRPTDFVFASQRSDQLSRRGVEEALRPFGVHPHQLRHTYGMRLQRAGRPLPEIARLMGHSSVVTTMQSYGTPSELDLRGAVESIDPGGDDD